MTEPDAPRILAIETSHSQGSVALLDSDGRPREQLFSPGLVHGREVVVRIDEVMQDAGWNREDLGMVAVSVGPGSYTGTRIGVAAAKALAFALSIPVVGVSTLEAVARNVVPDGDFAVVLDARRQRIYCARFRKDVDGLERLSPDAIADPALFLDSLAPGTPLLGESLEKIPGADRFPRLAREWDLPRASSVAQIARESRAATDPEAAGSTPVHALVPVYLRRSEAEERWDERAR